MFAFNRFSIFLLLPLNRGIGFIHNCGIVFSFPCCVYALFSIIVSAESLVFSIA